MIDGTHNKQPIESIIIFHFADFETSVFESPLSV